MAISLREVKRSYLSSQFSEDDSSSGSTPRVREELEQLRRKLLERILDNETRRRTRAEARVS